MPKMTAPETSLQPVGIIGLGLMGQGIVTCLLAYGCTVVAYDQTPGQGRATRAHVATALRELTRRGIVPTARARTWRRRLTIAKEVGDLAPCRFVIEAVTE